MTPLEIFVGIVLPSLIALTATASFALELWTGYQFSKPVKKRKEDEDDRPGREDSQYDK